MAILQVGLFSLATTTLRKFALYHNKHHAIAMSRRMNMIAPACSSLLFLSSFFFAPTAQAFIVGPSKSLQPTSARYTPPVCMILRDAPPADFTVIDDGKDDGDNINNKEGTVAASTVKAAEVALEEPVESTPKKEPVRKPKVATAEKAPKRNKSPKKATRKMDGTSWLQKNAAFNDEEIEEDPSSDNNGSKNTGFRQDFQGTRVFVQGIPKQASWQDLKDHFAVAGNVVFASVSVDSRTGESKGVGLVQFETTEMAVKAIKCMRDHPLNGRALYVREDVQEQRSGRNNQFQNPPSAGNSRREIPPNRWECADDENSSVLSPDEKEAVVELIKSRDGARRRKNYDASDQMRQELKSKFGVHVDDRLKQWWVSFDGTHVPQKIQATKGDGRWGGKTQWRQIPTTRENDVCVNPDLVNGLLVQRDIARQEKDFNTADSLLEEARSSPDGDLYLRIHDESRTWRIWTDAPPPRAVRHDEEQIGPAEQCIALVREKAPHKEDEIRTLLEKFPGREFPILRKLKKSLKDL